MLFQGALSNNPSGVLTGLEITDLLNPLNTESSTMFSSPITNLRQDRLHQKGCKKRIKMNTWIVNASLTVFPLQYNL